MDAPPYFILDSLQDSQAVWVSGRWRELRLRVILGCQMKLCAGQRSHIITWCTSYTPFKINTITLSTAYLLLFSLISPLNQKCDQKNATKIPTDPDYFVLSLPCCWYQLYCFYFRDPSWSCHWNHQSNNSQWCCQVQLQVIAPIIRSGNPTHILHTPFPTTLLLLFTTNDWWGLEHDSLGTIDSVPFALRWFMTVPLACPQCLIGL